MEFALVVKIKIAIEELLRQLWVTEYKRNFRAGASVGRWGFGRESVRPI